MNKELRIKNKKTGDQSGFTLIELLAVMIIVMTIGTVIATIIISVIRGSNKTNVLNNVRQNGNSALLQMSKMIQYAQNFEGVSADCTRSDCEDQTFTNSCSQDVPVGQPTPIPVSYEAIRIKSFDGGITTFVCDLTEDIPVIASMSASTSLLTDPDVVRVRDCSFTCKQDSFIGVYTIGINFSLSQKNASAQVDQSSGSSPVPFSTSVTFRNFTR